MTEQTPATGRPQRILVVGGTGFLGGAFVRALGARGHRPAVLSRRPERVAARFPDLPVEGRGGDVTRPASLAGSFEDTDLVIQCAQFPGFPVEAPRRGRTFMEVDARGTEHVVAAAVPAGVRRIVYLSGVGADPAASRHWFRAKAIAEQAVADSGLAYTVVRPSWVYGPADRSLNRFVQILRCVPLLFPQLGDGKQRINPVFVDDVARLVTEIVDSEAADGATIEIGGPATYTMDHIIGLLMEVLDRRKPIVHGPLPLVLAGALLLEPLPAQLLSRDAVRFATQEAVADNRELRRLFPDLPLTPMPDALRSYLGARAS